jgi:hypothetical protein
MQTTYQQDKLEALKEVIRVNIRVEVRMARQAMHSLLRTYNSPKYGRLSHDGVCHKIDVSGRIRCHMTAARRLKEDLADFESNWG